MTDDRKSALETSWNCQEKVELCFTYKKSILSLPLQFKIICANIRFGARAVAKLQRLFPEETLGKRLNGML